MIKALDDPNYRQVYLDSVNASLGCWQLAQDQFNPFNFEGEERKRKLAEYDLPAEPIEHLYPSLHQFWRELFSPETQYICANLDYSPAPSCRKMQTLRGIGPKSLQQSSSNWAGASLTARDGRMFTDVMAKWKVPSIEVPEGMAQDAEYKTSCWVGLDGQRAYANSTLPQIGTEHSINKGDERVGSAAAVWFQWWPMDEMLVSDDALPISPHDHVYFWLTAVSDRRVRCIIKVISAPGTAAETHRLMRFYADAPRIKFSPPETPDYAPRISGATAEWISEAPTSKLKQQILPLPNFNVVTFEHFFAYSARKPRDETRVEPLDGLKLAQIYVIDKGRRVTISRPERPRETKTGLVFDVKYAGRR